MKIDDDVPTSRFAGLGRLYGNEAIDALARAHMVVVGLGGVGSWAAEALARSGVGELTLIDLDDVCESNINRQVHALSTTIGKPKVEVMTARLRAVNPALKVNVIHEFLTQKNMLSLVHSAHNVVIDAMDSVHTKSALAAYCSKIKVRLIIVGSSGGKSNPTLVRVADLGKTESDPMLAKLRTQLYRHHHFSRDPGRKFRIDAVYSPEQMVYPKPDGSVCMNKSALANGVKLDCAGGFGSSVMVTGNFGFVAAAKAIERYLATL